MAHARHPLSRLSMATIRVAAVVSDVSAGEYADDETVVVRYQTRDGQSGVDVVTPLVTDEGPALLVNRGWLATGNVGIARRSAVEPLN